MLKIRLARVGRKKLPVYHIVVTKSTSPRDSKYIEKIGVYIPSLEKNNPERLVISKDRLRYWSSVGAIPTKVVSRVSMAYKPVS